jgi:hypothetical protein
VLCHDCCHSPFRFLRTNNGSERSEEKHLHHVAIVEQGHSAGSSQPVYVVSLLFFYDTSWVHLL